MEFVKIMTEEEIHDILGDIHVTFESYYKYDFWFKGEPQRYYHTDTEPPEYYSYRVHTRYGGNKDDIYRYNVSVYDSPPLFPFSNWTYVKVERRKEFGDPWEVLYEEDTY